MGANATALKKAIIVGPTAPYNTLNDALNKCKPHGHIYVLPGTYVEGKITITKPVTISGISKQILQNPPSSSSKQRHEAPPVKIVATIFCDIDSPKEIKEARDYFPRTILQNLELTTRADAIPISITRGEVILSDCIVSGGRDGIVVQSANSRVSLRNVLIKEASAAGVLWHTGAVGIMEDCKIKNCPTGVCVTALANPRVTNCSISNCGTGLHAKDGGKGVFVNCVFEKNEKPSILVSGHSNPLVDHCTIREGFSNGIFCRDGAIGVFVECNIMRNELPGVAICENADPVFINCNITEGSNAGALVYDNGKGVFSSCSIHTNRMPCVEVRTAGDPVVKFSEIYDGESNCIYVHNRGKGAFLGCSIRNAVLPTVAVRTLAEPLFSRCVLTTGRDNALLVCDRGDGSFLGCELYGYATRTVEVRDGCTPLIHKCSAHDGKFSTIVKWLDSIPRKPNGQFAVGWIMEGNSIAESERKFKEKEKDRERERSKEREKGKEKEKDKDKEKEKEREKEREREKEKEKEKEKEREREREKKHERTKRKSSDKEKDHEQFDKDRIDKNERHLKRSSGSKRKLVPQALTPSGESHNELRRFVLSNNSKQLSFIQSSVSQSETSASTTSYDKTTNKHGESQGASQCASAKSSVYPQKISSSNSSEKGVYSGFITASSHENDSVNAVTSHSNDSG